MNACTVLVNAMKSSEIGRCQYKKPFFFTMFFALSIRGQRVGFILFPLLEIAKDEINVPLALSASRDKPNGFPW